MTAEEPRGASAPRGLPAPGGPPLGRLHALLPPRSDEDKAAGEIPVVFGSGKQRKTVRLRVLPIRANREWKEHVGSAISSLVDRLAAEGTGDSILATLLGLTDVQLDLLASYGDQLDRAWLEETATEEQVLSALLGVMAASFPTEATLLAVLTDNRDLQNLIRVAYWRSTSSSPPSTDGAPASSKSH